LGVATMKVDKESDFANLNRKQIKLCMLRKTVGVIGYLFLKRNEVECSKIHFLGINLALLLSLIWN
jgi:hypothetical protein